MNSFEASWDVKIEEQQYRDEDHDLSLALMRFHNKPSESKSALSPFFGGHVGYFVEDLPSVLHRMEEEQLGKVIVAWGPDGASNHAIISDPERNALQLKTQ